MSFFTALVTSKIAAGALAASALAAGGTAAAAYTGSLPEPLQQEAHSLIGAPPPSAAPTAAPTDKPSPTSAHVGPDATGPEAFGLCTAFTHGGLDASSAAFASLAKAAKGAANITDFCAKVAPPGKSGDHRPSDTATPGGHGHGEDATPDDPKRGAKARG
ncbi:hypothetical protein SPF06_09050 [Sinomonas sp. JGH33]|uniref:Protein tyrosine phosphatase n=1 Tax=Sinomonas terricola TaxID=3110330 RepID=A0ABU5T5C6_9MICC|nr:hypothetical protein [Sinomonas sp. JGH33]MEA5454867.1 hypothetical protein [Sinomonas sp. JGH33]